MDIESFLRHMHDGHDSKAHAHILGTWNDEDSMRDKTLPVSDFISHASAISYMEFEDFYFGINNYYYPKHDNRRLETNTWGLNSLVVDYDYYRIKEYAGLSPEEMYHNHIKETLDFEPTYVIDSGRGLYLIYKFTKCPKTMLPLYRALYKEFIQRQKRFGADPAAGLATQVIRIPGTINSKSNTAVEILEANVTEYSITDFTKILSYTYEQTSDLNLKIKKEVLKRKSKQYTPEQKEKKSYRRAKNIGFYKKLIEDFKKLIKLRNITGSQNDGYRELLIYHARYFADYNDLTDKENESMAKELNNLFNTPMNESVMLKQTKTDPKLIRSTVPYISTIMNKLRITEYESQFLQVLTSKEEKRKRKLKRMANSKRKLHFGGKTEFQFELHLKRKIVYELHQTGMMNKDIASNLDIKAQTVTNYLRYIKSHLYEFMKPLEDLVELILGYIHNDSIVRTLTPTHYQLALEALEMTGSPPD